MNHTPTIEQKIAERINPDIAGELTVSGSAGGLAFRHASEALEFAKMMAISSVAVPKHLRGNPGACLAVVIQAIEWKLSPYAVANKSYSVNDRLAFESQLIQAVILQRAPIKGRLKVEYSGENEDRVCKVWAELEDGERVEYESPPFGAILPKNSPLWKADPDQQHFYYSARALCRRHFPDVLLGIYARDELDDEPAIGPDHARDVTPKKSFSEKLDILAAQPEEPTPEETAPEATQMPADAFVAADATVLPLDEPAAPVEPLNVGKARQKGRDDRARGNKRTSVWKAASEETKAYFEGYDEEP
jgi:hypothetical protein